MLESLFGKIASLRAENFIKKRLQHSCFPVKFAKFLRTPFSTEYFRWVLLKSEAANRRCSIKISVLKNFAIFTGKHLCQSLFLSCHFIKKETLAQGFSCDFCKIFKNTFFTKHLWMTASMKSKNFQPFLS